MIDSLFVVVDYVTSLYRQSDIILSLKHKMLFRSLSSLILY